MKGVWSIYSISDEIKIAEVSVPEEYIGMPAQKIDFRELHNIKLLAVKQCDQKLSTPSLEKWNAIESKDLEVSVVLEKDMRLIIKGRKKDIIKFIQ
ncbi:MAG: hypothetical protein IPJ37_14880 [Bacteroidales bacterium]|nr:hypothetical protein [Bacteroidales bacterium]